MAKNKKASTSKNKKASKKSSATKSAKKSKPEKASTRPLRITDTTLRDAHQCLWDTRMRTRDMLGIIDVIDHVGYYSLEVWGGDTFYSCLHDLRENPWERLRQIKKRTKNTPLQMLLRGQNLLGYKSYPDDLLDKFIQLAVQNGMDIFRIFDALNDTRNLEKAVEFVKKYGAHAQGTICYTVSPVHTIEGYVKCAKEQAAIGIDSLVIKDMAGLLDPFTAEKLVKALKKEVKLPIQVHTHSVSGMAVATYVESVRAGAGAIDCAISPLSGSMSQPPVESLVSIFNHTDYDTGLDRDALRLVSKYFEELTPARRSRTMPVNSIDPEILEHQLPGWMISGLRAHLTAEQELDRLDDVLREIPRIRRELGYPPLGSPTSRIIGDQAIVNVLSGKRYSKASQEIKDYIAGYYGTPPAAIDPKIRNKILGKKKPITCRPADLLEPALPHATENIDPALVENEEDIVSYLMFPEAARDYFEWRSLPTEDRPPIPADVEEAEQDLAPAEAKKDDNAAEPFLPQEDYRAMLDLLKSVNQLGLTEFTVKRNDIGFSIKGNGINQSPGMNAPVPQTETLTATPSESSMPAPTGPTIDAPLNGNFYASPSPDKPHYVKEGQKVKAGDVVCIVEAMKMFNEIKAPCDGKVKRFLVSHADAVEKGQPLIEYTEL